MKKKLLVIMLSLAMVFVPTFAFAEESVSEGNTNSASKTEQQEVKETKSETPSSENQEKSAKGGTIVNADAPSKIAINTVEINGAPANNQFPFKNEDYEFIEADLTVKDVNGNIVNTNGYSVSKAAASYNKGKKVGEYIFVVNGKGSYNGSVNVSWSIVPATITSVTIKDAPAGNEYAHTGSNIEFTKAKLEVKAGNLTLGDNDYEISGDTSKKDAGSYSLKVTAKTGGNFTGEASVSWSIAAPKELTDSCLTITSSNLTYTGKDQSPSFKVEYGGVEVPSNCYTVTGNKGKAADTYTLTITPNKDSGYTGGASQTWEISPAEVTSVTIKDAPAGNKYTYKNGAYTFAKANLIVKAGELTLTANDYDIVEGSDTSGTNVNSYTINIEGTGNFTGSVSVDWEIEPAEITEVKINGAPINNEYSFTNSAKEFAKTDLVVKAGQITLVAADFEISGDTSKTNVGDYTLTVTAANDTNFTGSKNLSWKIKAAAITEVTIKDAPADNEYSYKEGTTYTPELIVKAGDLTLDAAHYEATGDLSASSEGEYKITVTAANGSNYSGSKSVDWSITKSIDKVTFSPKFEAKKYSKDEIIKNLGITCEYFDKVDNSATINGSSLNPGYTLNTDTDYTFVLTLHSKKPGKFTANTKVEGVNVVGKPEVGGNGQTLTITFTYNFVKVSFSGAQKFTDNVIAEVKDDQLNLPEAVFIEKGSTVAEQSAPTFKDAKKTGYVFKGWYTDNTYASKFDFTTPMTESTTVYAMWEGTEVNNIAVTIGKNPKSISATPANGQLEKQPDVKDLTIEDTVTTAQHFHADTANGYIFAPADKIVFTVNGVPGFYSVENGHPQEAWGKCITLKVNRKSVTELTITGPTDTTYNGTEQEVDIVVKDGDKTLEKGTDYELHKDNSGTYAKNDGKETDAGTYKYKVVGLGDYYDTTASVYTWTIEAKDVEAANSGVSVDAIADQTYTASELEPSAVAKDSLITSSTISDDYDCEYEDNTAVGTATVTLTFKNNYKGTLTKTFNIVYGQTHTVKFYAGEVTGELWGTPQNVEHGKKASTPQDPSKDGFEFAGWAVAVGENVGEVFLFDNAVKCDYKLVAKWVDEDDKGNIETKTESETLEDTKSNIESTDIPLTNDEEKAVEEGKKLEVKLDVEVADVEAVGDDKDAIDEVLKKDQNVGIYLDIGITKYIDGVESGSVSETINPVTITITIPENLREAGRKYSIVRVHNGEAVVIAKDLTPNANWEISFSSDRFSTYALAYKDKAKDQKKEDEKTESPKTGDNQDIDFGFALLSMLISGLGIGFILRKRELED